MTEKRQAAAGLDFHLLLLLLLLLFHSSALAQKLETEPVGTRTALGAIGQTFSNAIRFVRSGQAEFAVELFRTAFEADNSFLLAKAWEMRAYTLCLGTEALQ